MNYFTFIDSTSVLSKYLALFVQNGYTDKCCKDVFNNIRSIGMDAEKEMFIKTEGINTHKGMLFLIGIACAAVGKAKINNLCEEFIERNISPGGSADLLAVTVFLCLVEQYMRNFS